MMSTNYPGEFRFRKKLKTYSIVHSCHGENVFSLLTLILRRFLPKSFTPMETTILSKSFTPMETTIYCQNHSHQWKPLYTVKIIHTNGNHYILSKSFTPMETTIYCQNHSHQWKPLYCHLHIECY